ncbi:conserved protein [Tepidicaulis marinus]|uniref:Conserved protein n=1 Tax=Tepidicaulis marinus TaxID=1333998 RepID=A0A081BC63_9HYPH|nr:hypothetical protein [Tepidicaulis marinus]GAK45631.1 conserved protein [Tepidicaulis marinus]
MPKPLLPALVDATVSGRLSAAEFERALHEIPAAELAKAAHAFGIQADRLPDEPELLARILAREIFPASHRKPVETETAFIGEFVKADPHGNRPFIVLQDNGKGVHVIPAGKDGAAEKGRPRGERPDEKLAGPGKETGNDTPGRAPDGEAPAPEEPGDTPGNGLQPPVERNATPYYRANIKLVMYIPYEPNNFPVPNRILPQWRGQMNGIEDPAMRLLLATGNPPPPDSFSDRAAFQRFVDSKEYRGIIDIDLMFCCGSDGQVTQGRKNFTTIVGFTPSFANVPVDQLHQHHLDHETMTSQVERAFQSGANNVATAMLDQAASTVTPNDFEVPADALKKALEHNNHPSTAESFSQGVSRVKESELIETSTSCRAYFAEQQVQVNPVDNVFYYMLTGCVLPYAWTQLRIDFCCDTHTLEVVAWGSSIPNRNLYINNRKVTAYDMLSQNFDVIKHSIPFGPPEGNADSTLVMDPTSAGRMAFTPESEIRISRALPGTPGCPASIPSDWLYDP